MCVPQHMHAFLSLVLLSPPKVRLVPPNLRWDRTARLGHMGTTAARDPRSPLRRQALLSSPPSQKGLRPPVQRALPSVDAPKGRCSHGLKLPWPPEGCGRKTLGHHPSRPPSLPTHGLPSLPSLFCLLGGDGFLGLSRETVCVPRVVAGLAGLIRNVGGVGATSG